MASAPVIKVTKVQATRFRDQYRRVAARARGNRAILILNRRQKAKYLVDKDYFDRLLKERKSILATLEVLADPKLSDRLLKLASTVDADVRAGRLHSWEEVFGGS